jgi:uncharacterized RDD family membrane protein YckC
MADPAAPLASLRRRLLALVYEILLLAAVLFAVALVAVPASFLLDPLLRRPFLQCFLAGAAAVYFVWQWSRGGQTLAMKTWHLRLVTCDGTPLAPARAVARFAAALGGLAAAGTGFLWALVDRDRQFLHDRLAGTRIVFEEPPTRARRS